MVTGLTTLALLSLAQGLLLLVSHIVNNTFPQPLSEEEERHYLQRLSAGDAEARNILTERNLRLVAHIVKKFENFNAETDDLISIGTIGLIKAINTFDPHRGIRLATYAARCIENEILMYLRFMKKTRSEVSLYEPLGTDREGNEITLMDILGTDPEAVTDKVAASLEQQRLLRKMGTLSKREKRVLEMRLGLNREGIKTQREIARMLGISRSYVSRIEKRALDKLVKELGLQSCS
ncbi:MAG: RNA polymerase sporulation sigma factor SigK [Desulfotomaculales bacterium]